VARVFEAPLHGFADRASAKDLGQRSVAGVTYPVRSYRHGDHEVTGATARILERLGDIVQPGRPG
jgi:hypothetical protein